MASHLHQLVEYILWSQVVRRGRFAGMKNHARELIARNVRALRTARGMTQEDLAGAAEIDRSYVSLIENQHFSISIDQIEKLAEVFEVDIHEMLHPDTATKAAPETRD